MKEEIYEIEDLMVPHLTFSFPTPVRIVLDEKYIRLYVGPRDWQFDRKTKECVGRGTGLGCDNPQPVGESHG